MRISCVRFHWFRPGRCFASLYCVLPVLCAISARSTCFKNCAIAFCMRAFVNCGPEKNISKISVAQYKLSSLVPIWPSQSYVRETSPPSFKESYPNTRVIINCPGVSLNIPPFLGEQAQFSKEDEIKTKELKAFAFSNMICRYQWLQT